MKSLNSGLFKTRLLARYAFYFYFLGWHWEYRPEAEDWQPDFLIKIPCWRSECAPDGHELLTAVKDCSSLDGFKGTTAYSLWEESQEWLANDSVMLLGNSPEISSFCICHGPGGGEYDIPYFAARLCGRDLDQVWQEAKIESEALYQARQSLEKRRRSATTLEADT